MSRNSSDRPRVTESPCPSCTSLIARLQQAERERDEARADAGELAAITTVVSDQEEVGTYAKVEALVIAKEVAERLVLALRGYVNHQSSCSQHRGSGGTCFARGPVHVTWGAMSCRLAMGHDGPHVNGNHEWPDVPCTCGLSSLLTDRSKEKK